MSIIKQFEICCDICKTRRPWSMELLPNTRGITKGGGTTDVRAEAKESGWTRRPGCWGVQLDVCDDCRDRPTPEPAWFQTKNRPGESSL